MGLRIHFHPLVAPPADLEPFPVEMLAALLMEHGVGGGEGALNCILTDDAELAVLNERFRHRPGPTDVLAFPYTPAVDGSFVADIYVSLDRAAVQARERGESVAREVWRLFVHEALHVAGHAHETDAAEEVMSRVQEQWVERVWPQPERPGK